MGYHSSPVDLSEDFTVAASNVITTLAFGKEVSIISPGFDFEPTSKSCCITTVPSCVFVLEDWPKSLFALPIWTSVLHKGEYDVPSGCDSAFHLFFSTTRAH